MLTILALVYTIDGLLDYIGTSFNITATANNGPLSLNLIFSYLFYPLVCLASFVVIMANSSTGLADGCTER